MNEKIEVVKAMNTLITMTNKDIAEDSVCGKLDKVIVIFLEIMKTILNTDSF